MEEWIQGTTVGMFRSMCICGAMKGIQFSTPPLNKSSWGASGAACVGDCSLQGGEYEHIADKVRFLLRS